jgi:ribonuclease HI
MNLIAHIDGSCTGNPGESGCGMVLKDGSGRILESAGWYLGQGTNNTAEYHGLIRCLERAVQAGAKQLAVRSDSQLLVNQILGIYKVKKAHLAQLRDEIFGILKTSGLKLDIQYIPREQNREADGLARKAIRLKTDCHEADIHFPGHSG